jgi:hypothetical protein
MRFAFCFTTVEAPKGWALDVPKVCDCKISERERERLINNVTKNAEVFLWECFVLVGLVIRTTKVQTSV